MITAVLHAEQRTFCSPNLQGEGEEYKKAKDFDKPKIRTQCIRPEISAQTPTEATPAKPCGKLR